MDAPRVDIDGSVKRVGTHKQYKVVVGGHAIYLQGQTFRAFAMLALCRRNRKNKGWVSATEMFGRPRLTASYLFRLRSQIRNALLKKAPVLAKWQVTENDHEGSYRLATKLERIRVVNSSAIIEFGDHDLVALLTRRERKGK